MSKRKPIDDHIRSATKAHTSLTLFAAVAEMATGADVSADYYGYSQRIAKIARDAQQRCLRDHDKAVAQIKRLTSGGPSHPESGNV